MDILHHKIYGTSGNTPIYILHGIFGMLDNWHYLGQQLQNEYTVVTFDARNHGRSFHSEEMGFEQMAEDVARLADHLGHKKFILMGHSMGGKTAMMFAKMYPQRLRALIVVDIANKTYKPGHLPYFEAFENIDFSEMRSRSEAEQALLYYAPDLSVRQFLLKNLEPLPLGGYTSRFYLQGIKKNYYDVIGAIELGKDVFHGPTLFISGEKSSYVKDEDKISLKMSFPTADFTVVPNAGHWVHAENASGFITVLKQFLSTIRD